MHFPGSTAVLVTGGTGFIGSRLVRRLVADGAQVHVLARAGSPTWRLSSVLGEIELWRSDITDSVGVAEILRSCRPRLIFNLAGETRGRRMDVPWDYFRAGIEVTMNGMLNLIKASQELRLPLDRFVQTGGLQEYGNGPLPFRENQREQPVSFYSAAQTAATHYCQMVHRTLGFPVTVLRPALIYGPGQSLEFFIPSLITHGLLGRMFPMSNGDQSRDLLYVDDLVDAYVRAASYASANGEVINISSGAETSLNDIVEVVHGLMPGRIHIEKQASGNDVSDLRHLYGHNEKARRLLGWSPQTPLREGLRRTVDWYSEHPEGRDRLESSPPAVVAPE